MSDNPLGLALIDRLTKEPEEKHNGCDGVVYDLAEIRRLASECVELNPGLLAVDGAEHWLTFAVFQSFGGVGGEGEKMQLVFHGSGAPGYLRELRHTHWGESGYLFYPNGKLIASAFSVLTRWFDCVG